MDILVVSSHLTASHHQHFACFAEQLSTDWMEFRKIEKYAEQGKSRTRELLWSWAQKNKTIGDLLQILQKMGHKRAIHLFTRQVSLPSQNHQFKEFTDVTSKVLETLESTSQVCCFSEDLPRSLRSYNPPLPYFYHVQSVPVENDESQDFALSLPNRFNTDEKVPKHPCECSQSEVTFLGTPRTVGSQSTGYGIKVSPAGQDKR
uniref:Interleukin-1 receptor-associated kinase 3 isoform X2 n=1 Tax=Geotrypetes seraphini TaxID=260995 RepID=A0A6P8SJR5_GEOSA|nr:interleukin-1 receptor-associated kinase 3 isoform X2 [Geotrypetes seraphini]